MYNFGADADAGIERSSDPENLSLSPLAPLVRLVGAVFARDRLPSLQAKSMEVVPVCWTAWRPG